MCSWCLPTCIKSSVTMRPQAGKKAVKRLGMQELALPAKAEGLGVQSQPAHCTVRPCYKNHRAGDVAQHCLPNTCDSVFILSILSLKKKKARTGEMV